MRASTHITVHIRHAKHARLIPWCAALLFVVASACVPAVHAQQRPAPTRPVLPEGGQGARVFQLPRDGYLEAERPGALSGIDHRSARTQHCGVPKAPTSD
jgi:hypothetical protein